MFDQEDSDLGVVVGVVFGVIALVIALVIGLGVYKLSASAAPAGLVAAGGDVTYTEVEEIGEGFYRITLRYGFMDQPNIPRDLQRLHSSELPFQDNNISYFLGRETLLSKQAGPRAMERETLRDYVSQRAEGHCLLPHPPRTGHRDWRRGGTVEGEAVLPVGIEPTTYGLRVRCSAN